MKSKFRLPFAGLTSIGRVPTLSIIVIFFNMRREAERTLHSLSSKYQLSLSDDEYEVIAIDNGSSEPISESAVKEHGRNFRFVSHQTRSKSPVDAINLGVSIARGRNVAIIVDGARMASPGLVSESLRALSIFEKPLVGSLSWHLGPDVQNVSIVDGYCQSVEDTLLDEIDWPSDGYRLFEISVLAQSSGRGFLNGMPNELSWICLPRKTFWDLNGYDASFQSPGGGLVNQDFLKRALALSGITPVMLLGEGVFHQFHGGVATNVVMADHPLERFRDEYKRIRGVPYAPTTPEEVHYYGTLRDAAKRSIK